MVVSAGRTILVADESRENRGALAASLRLRGYSVIEAEDGEEAHRRIREDAPDLALLGGVLPLRTGIELCMALKADEGTRALPVILLSSITRTVGRTDEHWRRRTGADAFLSEPYDPRSLFWLIEQFLLPDLQPR